jgi:hypothetical protein
MPPEPRTQDPALNLSQASHFIPFNEGPIHSEAKLLSTPSNQQLNEEDLGVAHAIPNKRDMVVQGKLQSIETNELVQPRGPDQDSCRTLNSGLTRAY